MALIDDFLKAYVYFIESGLPEKMAKDIAEKVTGAKVTDDEVKKAFNPEVKKTMGDPAPKTLATKKKRSDLTFINTKISDPQKSSFVTQGLDGTTENLYSKFRREQSAIKKGMEQDLRYVKENNIALGAKDKENILHNLQIYNGLSNKVTKLEGDLIEAGKEPEKIFKEFTSNFLNRKRSANEPFEKRLDEEYIKDQKTMKSLNESLDKMQKDLKDLEDIASGKSVKKEIDEGKLKFQGKGYGVNSPLYRMLSRQFLVEQGKAGKIDLDPNVLKQLAENPGTIDAIKIFRHHYGDDAFDKLGDYLNYGMDYDLGPKYPGQKFFEENLGIVVKKKSRPGETIKHYELPGELEQEIKEIDDLVSRIESGNSPYHQSKEAVVRGILDANSRRAQLVKVKNDLVPEDTVSLPGDDLLESADILEFPDDTNYAKGGIVSI